MSEARDGECPHMASLATWNEPQRERQRSASMVYAVGVSCVTGV